LAASGAKSDRIDAKVLALMLLALQAELRPLKPDAPEMVALRLACEDRVRLVEERTAKLNELQGVLKVHYPAFLDFFGNLESDIALAFLEEFPTQDAMRALKPGRLRSWLRRHHYTAMHRLEAMQAMLTQPVLPVAPHRQQAKAPLIRYLAASLRALQKEIAERQRAITAQFEALPEASWAGSLPGAGPTLAPAILACIGRDVERFQSVDEARALMGTAPVTKQSGRSCQVRWRWGCWKFARRTMQLFAEQSRHVCGWAQALYEKQRATGHTHHQALRALAHKWLKIILALQRSGEAYDEARFVNSQRRYLSKKTAACA
jgi:transposase